MNFAVNMIGGYISIGQSGERGHLNITALWGNRIAALNLKVERANKILTSGLQKETQFLWPIIGYVLENLQRKIKFNLIENHQSNF